MKKNALLIIVSFSAFLLLQCQNVKDVLKELNEQSSTEESKEQKKTDEDKNNDKASSSSEANKKRKEVK